MQSIIDPSEVINFLGKNRAVFGDGRKITYSRMEHGCCTQLRQFFGNEGDCVAFHYEIQVYRNKIVVEVHSEQGTPRTVHEFIRKQVEWTPKEHQPTEGGSYRFATQEIEWSGRSLDEIVEDIKAAVDKIYRKYDAYLNYVEGYYAGKGSVEGCKSYKEFMHKVTALNGEQGT